MAISSISTSSSDRAVLQQHNTLKSLLTAISSRLETSQEASRNLVSLFNALAFHLQTHFEFEEEDDYFPTLVQLAPRKASTVEMLIHEHREMLAEVEGLVQIARDDFETRKSTDLLTKRFAEFREKLEAHEHVENLLLQDVYTEDIGTKD